MGGLFDDGSWWTRKASDTAHDQPTRRRAEDHKRPCSTPRPYMRRSVANRCIYAVLRVDFLNLQEILPPGVPKVIQEISWVLLASGFPGPMPVGDAT
ncbi:hypothetical protein CPC08DRAFT_702743, partial [Agrocybe pediades]